MDHGKNGDGNGNTMKMRMTGSSRPPVRGRVLFEGVFQIVFVFEDGDGDDMRWPSVLGGQQSVVERASPEPVLLVIHLMMRKAQITLSCSMTTGELLKSIEQHPHPNILISADDL